MSSFICFPLRGYDDMTQCSLSLISEHLGDFQPFPIANGATASTNTLVPIWIHTGADRTIGSSLESYSEGVTFLPPPSSV